MLESTPRSTLYHVYNRRYERSCKKVFDLDFQGHAIKIEFFHYHRWIPWPRKHTHEKYFWKIRTGRPKSRGGGVVPTPPLGVRRWIFTLGICGLKLINTPSHSPNDGQASPCLNSHSTHIPILIACSILCLSLPHHCPIHAPNPQISDLSFRSWQVWVHAFPWAFRYSPDENNPNSFITPNSHP